MERVGLVRMEMRLLLFRWRSADSNDYLCGYCKTQDQMYGKASIPGVVGPRAFGKVAGPRGFGKVAPAESMWKSGVKTKGKSLPLQHVNFLASPNALLYFSCMGTGCQSGTSNHLAIK